MSPSSSYLEQCYSEFIHRHNDYIRGSLEKEVSDRQMQMTTERYLFLYRQTFDSPKRRKRKININFNL